MTLLSDQYHLNYIPQPKLNKTIPVKVELFSSGDRHKLQVVKGTDKKCKIYEEIWLDKVGAISLTTLKVKKG